jgi:hypothetical protein
VTSCTTVATTYVTCGSLLSRSTLNVTLPGGEVFVGAQSVPVLLVDVSCAVMTRNATRNVTLPGDDVISFLEGGHPRGRHHNVTLLDPNRDSLRVTLDSINRCKGVANS